MFGALKRWLRQLLCGSRASSADAAVDADVEVHVAADTKKPPSPWPPGPCIPAVFAREYPKVIPGDIAAVKAVCITTAVAVLGNASVVGDTCITGNTLVAGDCNAKGAICITGNVIVLGSAHAEGDICITGDAFVKGDLQVKGKLDVGGKLCVWGSKDVQPAH